MVIAIKTLTCITRYQIATLHVKPQLAWNRVRLKLRLCKPQAAVSTREGYCTTEAAMMRINPLSRHRSLHLVLRPSNREAAPNDSRVMSGRETGRRGKRKELLEPWKRKQGEPRTM